MNYRKVLRAKFESGRKTAYNELLVHTNANAYINLNPLLKYFTTT